MSIAAYIILNFYQIWSLDLVMVLILKVCTELYRRSSVVFAIKAFKVDILHRASTYIASTLLNHLRCNALRNHVLSAHFDVIQNRIIFHWL